MTTQYPLADTERTTLRDNILNARSLHDLHTALVHAEARLSGADEDTDLAHTLNLDTTNDLSTFGGPEPADTQGIYSWDETRLLVYTGEWQLVDRED